VRAGLVAAGCAAVGAVAGITGGAAAPSGKSSANKQGAHGFAAGRRHGPWAGRGEPGMLAGGPPVHAELVVPKRSGGGFETVTEDSGKLKSSSGDKLTITEGTQSETYKEVDLTIPSNATIARNGNKATLADLKDGDFVHVSQSPEGTFVMARDASFQPRFGPRRDRDGGPHGPGGPPPFAP
jgi:hypothetical protein